MQVRNAWKPWPSVNTTSAHRRPVFVDCHSRWLGIDRQCTYSLHRNDTAYCHFELCRDCGLGCLSELLADIRRLSVAAVVFLYQITVFYNKTQQHHFWNFILMTQCKLYMRAAAAVAVNEERSLMGRWGRCSIYRHRENRNLFLFLIEINNTGMHRTRHILPIPRTCIWRLCGQCGRCGVSWHCLKPDSAWV